MPQNHPLLIDLIVRNIMPQYIPLSIEGWMLLGHIVTLVQGRLHLDNTRNYTNVNWWLIEYIPRYCTLYMLWLNSPVVNGVFGWWHCWLWVQILPLAVIFHGIGLDFIGLKDWINNINVLWKQLRLILWTLEIQDRINPTSVKLWLFGIDIVSNHC